MSDLDHDEAPAADHAALAIAAASPSIRALGATACAHWAARWARDAERDALPASWMRGHRPTPREPGVPRVVRSSKPRPEAQAQVVDVPHDFAPGLSVYLRGGRPCIAWWLHNDVLWTGTVTECAMAVRVREQVIRNARRRYPRPGALPPERRGVRDRKPLGLAHGFAPWVTAKIHCGRVVVAWWAHVTELHTGTLREAAAAFGVLASTIYDARRRHPLPQGVK